MSIHDLVPTDFVVVYAASDVQSDNRRRRQDGNRQREAAHDVL
jgi:hypothetical protein